MLQLSSKNDHSSLCYDVIITHQKYKIDKFGDFSSEIDFTTTKGVQKVYITCFLLEK